MRRKEGGGGWDCSLVLCGGYITCSCCSYLEAEGMERTQKFKQKDIAAAVPLANSLHVSEQC